jgi:hypothetical protein
MEENNDQPNNDNPITMIETDNLAPIQEKTAVTPPIIEEPKIISTPLVSGPELVQNQPVPTTTGAQHNPMLIVIQWLTYAFWGWTAVAVTVLAAMIFSYFLISKNVYSMVPYSLASVLVLLPISLVCEKLYGKKEPVKKIGIASVIMIIHAVIFALLFVGALVVIIFNLLTLLMSINFDAVTMSTVFTALVAAAFYAALFIRTIIPEKIFKFRKFIIAFLILVTLVMSTIGILGPVITSMSTKNDRLIEENLSSLSNRIDDYFDENEELPNSLNDLNINTGNGGVRQLIDSSLVIYKNESNKYQLCVKYVAASESIYDNIYDTSTDGGYETSVSTYSHPAGDVCYKVKPFSYKYGTDQH